MSKDQRSSSRKKKTSTHDRRTPTKAPPDFTKSKEAILKLKEKIADGKKTSVSKAAKTDTFEIAARKKQKDRMDTQSTGLGLYMGTTNLISMSEDQGQEITQKERNAFLNVRNDETTKDLLDKMGMQQHKILEKFYVLGDSAFALANIFDREAQKPMKIGVLNPFEKDAIPVLKIIMDKVLPEPRKNQEICCFSLPAQPIDGALDIIYYQGILEEMISKFGFKPLPLNEGYAVVLSELEETGYTGMGVSFGGGIINVCAVYKSIIISSFSILRGGEWIDSSAADVLEIPTNKVTAIKEAGMDIREPNSREQEALAIYYKHLIRYFVEQVTQVFNKSDAAPQFKEAVDIVFAGGTTMVDGFLEVIEKEMDSAATGISIKSIRRAHDPFTSVARGCLYNALQIEKRL